jgi:carboxyl-terminal processing protease
VIRASLVILFFAMVLAACASNQGTIGAVLAQEPDGRLWVREAPEGLAADKAGLEAGDEILLVEGMDVRQMDVKAVHEALSGEVGSKVRLTLIRDEEVLRVTLTRTPAKRRLLKRR